MDTPMQEGTNGTSLVAVEDRTFVRAMQQMPEVMRDSFSAAQLEAFKQALRNNSRKHQIDYRVSVPWLGRRTYVTLLAGAESRSIERLRDEGQITPSRIATVYGIGFSLIVGLMLLSGTLFLYSVNKMLEADNGGRTSYVDWRRN